MNLFRGVNGVGKTSLMEAIELSICGANRRNADTDHSDTRIRATFAGSTGALTLPYKDAKLYRQRDGSWYGGYYRSGNKLCYNFGRFNFFNSDAGFELTVGKDDVSVDAAVRSMFLGEYANAIQERMEKCLERFVQENRDNNRQKGLLELEISKARDGLTTIKAVKDTREALLKELIKKSKEAGWTSQPRGLDSDNLVALHESVEEYRTQVASDMARVPWLSPISFEIPAGRTRS